ncbi:MAG: hypothetical protein R2710_19090 [Acidimicrobiales bacterium]
MKLTSIGTGQVGENVRFVLTWSSDDPELPATVVGKFLSQSEISRSTGRITGTLCARSRLLPRPGVDGVDVRAHRSLCGRRPRGQRLRAHHARHPWCRSGRSARGCTVEQAELAVDQAAAPTVP